MIAMGLYVSPADIIYGLEINGGITVDGFLETQGLGVTRHWLKPKSLVVKDQFLIFNIENNRETPRPLMSIDKWMKDEASTYIGGLEIL